MIKTAGVIVILVGMSLAFVVQVEPGQVGVQKLFGKVDNNILESGLHIINPMVKVIMFDVRTENYTMSGTKDEGTRRDEFQNRIFTSIESNFKEKGLMLEQQLIRNLILPESVKTTIESKINADQEAQKITFVLQKERQEAERKRVEAQSIADYQKILSTGLSDKLLQYEMIKAISASPNAKLIFMTIGKSLPILVDSK